MKQLRASPWIEDDLIVAHCLDVDVASQIDRGGLVTAIVPTHREIAVGTLRSVLRHAGLSVEEWNSL